MGRLPNTRLVFAPVIELRDLNAARFISEGRRPGLVIPVVREQKVLHGEAGGPDDRGRMFAPVTP